MQNTEELFGIALGLKSPWKIKSVDFNEDKILNIEIGFDETSIRKGHNYITTTVDLEKRNVLFALEGKDSDCIKRSVSFLAKKDVDIENIEQVCIDMSPSFIAGKLKFNYPLFLT